MQDLFGASASEGEGEWLSISDLMAGLMVIFLFLAIVFVRPYTERNIKLEAERSRIENIAVTWQEQEIEIYRALFEEFEEDLPRWNAEIEEATLLIRFKSPDVLFERGRDAIRPHFAAILRDFFPRYAKVLEHFSPSIEEIRIEGHTSSVWFRSASAEEAYFRNMELSQARTRAVLQFVLGLTKTANERWWLQPLLTANGLSSSRPIRTADGSEDLERSRRVEFRVRTKVRSEIVRIAEEIQ